MDEAKGIPYIRNIFTSFEPTAYLFPTIMCNLSCSMCYSGSAAHPLVKCEVSEQAYLRLVDSLIDQGYTRFDISGGEPLLRDDLIYKLVKRIRSSGAKLHMVTNGTFLEKSLNKYSFCADDFDFIAVSLDSPDETTHNSIRGSKKAYRSALTGIKLLVANGFRVGLNMVYLSENKNQMSDLLQFANDLGVSFVHILRNRYVSLTASLDTVSELDWIDLYQELSLSLQSAPDNLLVIATLPQYIHQEITTQLRRCFRNKSNILIRSDCIGGCGAFKQNVAITSEGNVTGCVAMINEPKFWIGNINLSPVQEILEQFPEWVEKLESRSRILKTNNICRSCPTFCFCQGGCPMVAQTFCSDWKQADPSCNKSL
ncbi:radical SAM protein [Lacrimispora brassicae]